MIAGIFSLEEQGPKKEPPLEVSSEMRRQNSAGPVPAMTPGDGMKTHEQIDGYDPIANTLDNPLQNKQGVGGAGYDYSDYKKAAKDQ
jgi:hypothetical protein